MLRYDIRTGVKKIKTKTFVAIATIGLIAGGGGLSLAIFGTAQAASGYHIFGDATTQSDGVHLFADTTHANQYSGISFDVPAGTKVGSLSDLEATFQKVAGDCGGGSPRFSIFTPSGNIFVYFGTLPSFTPCSTGPSGNLLNSTEPRVEATQVNPTLPLYDNWNDVISNSSVSNLSVTGLALVTDASWLNQEFVFSSAIVNSTSYNFVPIPTKDDCKNNGWQTMKDTASHSFKNQGDCVSYFATIGKNTAAVPKH